MAASRHDGPRVGPQWRCPHESDDDARAARADTLDAISYLRPYVGITRA